MADFGRDLHGTNSLRGSQNFIIFGHVNNSQFHRCPVKQILRHLNTTTSIGEVLKTFKTEFLKFYHKVSFSPKMHKLLTFPGRATSDHHKSTMIIDCRKFTAKLTFYEMSSFHFYR